MKNIGLALCTLALTAGLNSVSFASNEIPEAELSAVKVTCQGILPDVEGKLKSWKEHRDINSKLREHLAKNDFAKVAKCLESANQMDALFNPIIDLSTSLFNSLGSLQQKYPEHAKDPAALMGIEERVLALGDPLDEFRNHYLALRK